MGGEKQGGRLASGWEGGLREMEEVIKVIILERKKLVNFSKSKMAMLSG